MTKNGWAAIVALAMLSYMLIQFKLVSICAFPLSFGGWLFLNFTFWAAQVGFWLFIWRFIRLGFFKGDDVKRQ